MVDLKLAFIDHYDSFSFNVLDWLYRSGIDKHEVLFLRCDDQDGLVEAKNLKIPLLISPGPHQPKDVPLTVELVRNSLGIVPVLGICLGHQILGYVGGAGIKPAKDPWHGSVQKIHILSAEAIFAGLPSSIEAASYNSLVVDRTGLSSDWKVLAENSFGEVMGMMRTGPGAPAWSVQFHPESFMSGHAEAMAANWLAQALPTAPLSMPS